MTVPQQPVAPPHFADQQEILRVPAETRQSARVRAFVRGCARNAGFDADAVAEIELAVGEAATNAILYGCAGCSAEAAWVMVIAGAAGPARFFVEVWDPGAGFDPARVRTATPNDVNALGGRGLPLMGALMDQVAWRHEPGRGMCVRLERYLGPRP
jgi:serine/threonine-protein kinase RsbW